MTSRDFIIKQCIRFVRARAWRYAANLPPSLELDDLIQVGTMSALAFFEKNGWPEDQNAPVFFLKQSVDGAMLNEINRANTGVKAPVKNGFSTTPFSYFASAEDDRDFIDFQDEQFGFTGAEFTPPLAPLKRMAIFQAAQSMLQRDFKGVSHKYESVRGVQKNGPSWSIAFDFLGNSFSMAGFRTKKDAAKAKYDLLVMVREAVLPIDPQAATTVGKERNAFSGLSVKSRGLECAGIAMPSFMYDDPLRVMLVLEWMCIKKTNDWTAYRAGL